ncbi:hypothetical protein HY003_03085 [Candidatus Saccharibacteria bacterium]|nr:hypothetical protein [Candidatus Saccharibacteria bacterium]MBI3338259.1 hypothetical protein [Candidatus Saccharibacteria bacterium]
MNQKNLEELYGQEVWNERLHHIDQSVVILQDVRDRKFGAPAVGDQYADQVKRHMLPTNPDTPNEITDTGIDFATEKARLLARAAYEQWESIDG